MADRTTIAWTGSTWNIARGCNRVAVPGQEQESGCTACYAVDMAHRFPWGDGLTRLRLRPHAVTGELTELPDWTGVVRLVPEAMDKPLRWRKPRRVFVCSGSDLFHHKIPFEYIAQAFSVMNQARRHTFQVLTKRIERAVEFLDWLAETDHPIVPDLPLPNVHIGTSCEDDPALRHRAPHLRKIDAAVRWISAEPLIGPLDSLAEHLDAIEWLVVGGESGNRARPCRLEWLRSIVSTCHAAEVPVFVKQLGRRPEPPLELLDGKGEDPMGFPPDLRVRQYPSEVVA